MSELPPALSALELQPLPASGEIYDAGAVVCLCVECNETWFRLLAGWIQTLASESAWEGVVEDVDNSINQVARIQENWSWGSCCMPVGSVTYYAGVDAPAGWLACDGSEVPQIDYPSLYEAIGDTFGSASADMFRLPDLRGRMVVGAGAGPGLTARNAGDTGGSEAHTLAEQEMPMHNHTTHGHAAAGAGGELPVPVAGAVVPSATTGSSGAGMPHENMSPFLVLTAIIKAG